MGSAQIGRGGGAVGTQIDFDTKNEKVAQICVQGATPRAQIDVHTFSKVKKHPKLRVGGNLGNGRKKLCFLLGRLSRSPWVKNK